jgi:hypothetical protein
MLKPTVSDVDTTARNNAYLTQPTWRTRRHRRNTESYLDAEEDNESDAIPDVVPNMDVNVKVNVT